MAPSLESENLKILKKNLIKPADFKKQNNDNKACFSYNYTKYGSLETWTLAYEKLKKLPENENVFHELILGDRVVKPYLDIEWYLEKHPDLKPDYVIMTIKEAVIDIFKNEWDFDLKDNEVYLGSCHRKKTEGYKYSYRLIVSTHPSVVFLNTNCASYLGKRIRKMCSEKFSEEIIDMSVYKKLQNMRLIGHSKAGEYIPMQKLNYGDEDMEYIITNVDPEYHVIQVPEQKDFLYKNIKNVKGVDFESPDVMKHIIDKIKSVHPSASVERVDANKFIQMNYSDRSEPCFVDGKTIHERIGFFCYIQDDLICLGCHSGNCVDSDNKKKITILGSIAHKQNNEYEKVAFNNTFTIDHSIIKECVMNGSFGISNLFEHMYLKPKRILWINDSKSGSTFYWDGMLWKQDEYSFVERLITNTVTNLLKEFVSSYIKGKKDNEDENVSLDVEDSLIKSTSNMIGKLNEGTNINNILRFLKSLLNDNEFIKIKDISPYLLSCKNGVVELKTGELRKCIPEDNMTRSLDTEYDIQARTDEWDNFVRQITSGEDGEDVELYNYIRWAVGYALQGSPSKKLFFILYGERGYNGKSMFLNMIKNVLGFYAVAMDKSVVVEGPSKTGGSHSTEICQLENSRFGILSETKEDEIINDGQMKMLTGVTDKLSVREIYGKQKEFAPTFVPFISSNHKLRINLKDPAMYERLILIPFRLSFVSDPTHKWQRKGDELLAEKFNKNKEGILKWLIECSVYYHQNINMPPPDIVMKAKMEYRREMDEYADFIDRTLIETGDPKDYVNLTEVCGLYKEYCSENSIKYERKKAEKMIIDCLSVNQDKKSSSGRIEKLPSYKFKSGISIF